MNKIEFKVTCAADIANAKFHIDQLARDNRSALPFYHVIDEDKSVKWNREQVAIINTQLASENENRVKEIEFLRKSLKSQINNLIKEASGGTLSEEEANKLRGMLEDIFHSEELYNDLLFDDLLNVISFLTDRD